MKLGTETGSLVNHIYSSMRCAEPQPGMGAAILGWTDRKAATIASVFKIGAAQAVTVQADIARRTDTNGFSEVQTYAFTPNPDASGQTFRQARDGSWREVRFNAETRRWRETSGPGLIIGRRDHYHDFSF